MTGLPRAKDETRPQDAFAVMVIGGFERQREDDAEFGNEGRSPNVLPGMGMIFTAILALALIAAGAWMAFG